MTAFYNAQPEELQYMQLPDGKADVWLRKNIKETTDEEKNAVWTCEEVYFRTSLSLEEIQGNFDTIFENGGVTVDEETKTESIDGVTTADRLDALEEGLAEIAEMVSALI